MASGWRRIKFNTQERILSPDMNRAQTFVHADSAEIFRYLMDVTSNDDLSAGAVIAEKSSLEAPVRAEILNGFMARPQIGNTLVTVDAGASFFLNPDGAADESNYKLLRYDGTALPLTIAPNASGSIRIDVLEVSIDAAEAVVTDSRDVFNASTGLFSASLIVKEGKSQADFRVRQGTPGSGYPAAVAGWLPLLVASVPTGSTSNDTVTFWDVRPIAKDRETTLVSQTRDWPLIRRANYVVDPTASKLVASGQFESSINGYRAGGTIRRGTPGTDADSVDFSDSANFAAGFSFAGTGFWYGYLLFPFGLPRWARYTDASSGSRLPRSPRGIFVTAGVAPAHLTGKPSSAVPLPASTGLGSSSSDGICVVQSRVTSNVPTGAMADGHVVWASKTLVSNDPGFQVAATGISTTGASFNVTEGVSHPPNAKAIYVRFELSFAAFPNNRILMASGGDVEVSTPAGTNVAFVPTGPTSTIVNGAPTALFALTGMVRIPLSPQYPGVSAGGVKNISWFYYLVLSDLSGTNSYTPPTPSGATMRIYGWDVSP